MLENEFLIFENFGKLENFENEFLFFFIGKNFRPAHQVSGGETDDSAPPVVVAEVKWTIPPLPSGERR